MAQTIDFNNVKKAMDVLASNPTALNTLDAHLKDFRQQIGVSLTDTEFRYVTERLIAQRESAAFHGTDAVSAVVAGGLRRLQGGWIIRTEPA